MNRHYFLWRIQWLCPQLSNPKTPPKRTKQIRKFGVRILDNGGFEIVIWGAIHGPLLMAGPHIMTPRAMGGTGTVRRPYRDRKCP